MHNKLASLKPYGCDVNKLLRLLPQSPSLQALTRLILRNLHRQDLPRVLDSLREQMEATEARLRLQRRSDDDRARSEMLY